MCAAISSAYFTAPSKTTPTSEPGTLRRPRQEDPGFEASVGYTVRSSLQRTPKQTKQEIYSSLPPYSWGVPKWKASHGAGVSPSGLSSLTVRTHIRQTLGRAFSAAQHAWKAHNIFRRPHNIWKPALPFHLLHGVAKCRPEDNFQKLALGFLRVRSENKTRIFRLGGKYIHLMSHFTSP